MLKKIVAGLFGILLTFSSFAGEKIVNSEIPSSSLKQCSLKVEQDIALNFQFSTKQTTLFRVVDLLGKLHAALGFKFKIDSEFNVLTKLLADAVTNYTKAYCSNNDERIKAARKELETHYQNLAKFLENEAPVIEFNTVYACRNKINYEYNKFLKENGESFYKAWEKADNNEKKVLIAKKSKIETSSFLMCDADFHGEEVDLNSTYKAVSDIVSYAKYLINKYN